jgi:hypothetical protein
MLERRAPGFLLVLTSCVAYLVSVTQFPCPPYGLPHAPGTKLTEEYNGSLVNIKPFVRYGFTTVWKPEIMETWGP